jgi:MATE family multidrug resistance protein
MLLSAFAIFLPFFYLTQRLELGNHGLWLAFIAFMAARGLSMGWIYRRRTPVR